MEAQTEGVGSVTHMTQTTRITTLYSYMMPVGRNQTNMRPHMVVVDTSTSVISVAGQATICSKALTYLDPFGGFSPLPKLSPLRNSLGTVSTPIPSWPYGYLYSASSVGAIVKTSYTFELLTFFQKC